MPFLEVAYGVIQLLSLIGKDDFPKLKDKDKNWLPLHYSQHCRASAGDLSEIWLDGHTICDNATGVPLARYSVGQEKIIPVTGYTLQGLPVYEDVPAIHPVWTTLRDVKSSLGSPGFEGEVMASRGGAMQFIKAMDRKGEKLIAFLGQYGPIDEGTPLPPALPPVPRGQSGGSAGLSGLATLAAIGLAVSGAWVPAAILGVLSVASGAGFPPVGSGGSPGGSPGGRQPGTGRGGRYIPPSLPPAPGSYEPGTGEDPFSPY